MSGFIKSDQQCLSQLDYQFSKVGVPADHYLSRTRLEHCILVPLVSPCSLQLQFSTIASKMEIILYYVKNNYPGILLKIHQGKIRELYLLKMLGTLI